MMKRNEKTAAYWRGHVRAQRTEGLSVRAYCRREGLADGKFYWWRRELARREGERARHEGPLAVLPAGPTAFAPIEVIGENPAGAGGDGPVGGPAESLEEAVSSTAGTRTPIEVHVTGGRRVVVAGGFDEAAFVRVVALLEGGAPC